MRKFDFIFGAFMIFVVGGTALSRYASCDVGFAAIDWVRNIPTQCDWNRR